jgi:hypothetical protein
MEAILIEKNKKIELLKKEWDNEVAALKSQLEVRNISMHKLFLSLTSCELQLLGFLMSYACDSASHLTYLSCSVMIHICDPTV